MPRLQRSRIRAQGQFCFAWVVSNYFLFLSLHCCFLVRTINVCEFALWEKLMKFIKEASVFTTLGSYRLQNLDGILYLKVSGTNMQQELIAVLHVES